mgnify:CR=1 FL=1
MYTRSDNLEDLANETSARQLADGNLQTQISTETTARQDADRALQRQIDDDKQDLADYKTAMANTINTGTVNANNVVTETLSASNSAHVGNQLSILKRGIANNGIVIKTFDNAYVTDSDKWYLLHKSEYFYHLFGSALQFCKYLQHFHPLITTRLFQDATIQHLD